MIGASVETGGTLERGEFRGNAGEYFGIWIVNILLTIVTLGIYSAWAKVRRMRYFRGNTYLDGHSFDYHAKGKQIFIGRMIVFVVLAIFQVVTTAFPLAAIITPFLFLAALPFFIVRSLRFNARVTSYRNIRFDFTGKSWGAFTAIVLGSVMAALSLGILAPLASRWSSRYVFNNLRYGDRPFSTDPKVGALYRALIPPVIIFVIGCAIVAAIAVLIAWPMFNDYNHARSDSVEAQVLMLIGLIYLMIIPLIVTYVVAGIIYRIAVRNIVLNAMLFDRVHPLYSDLSRLRYFWIVISNTVVTIATLGLMRPWAAVREQRYMVEHTGIRPQGEIGEVMASIQASGSAISAEYMDLEGVDFGF
ncbi:MAG: hypothetical protein JWM58_2452 [Rhizobium sp.]|nr:hypothetical protein [Rhizobium sp.]